MQCPIEPKNVECTKVAVCTILAEQEIGVSLGSIMKIALAIFN
jgi:hypothetical protein